MSGSSLSNHADSAILGGLVPFSATDYPGQFAAVVFFKGCPWRCRYCQNTDLQQRLPHLQDPNWDSIEAFLDARRDTLDSIVFSGGEPLASSQLAELAGRAKAMGFKVGLHSGGAYPERLRPMLARVDWVGLDIKAPFDAYLNITRTLGSGNAARQSLEILLQSGLPFKCRTTIHPDLHDEKHPAASGPPTGRDGREPLRVAALSRTGLCGPAVGSQCAQRLSRPSVAG